MGGDGRLDLVGAGRDGQAFVAAGRGSKNYHWQLIRPRAANATGDQRINSFGVGGEMKIRAGLLVQKQLITGPLVHFGLGDQAGADVVRVVWPNGSVRPGFKLKADTSVLAEPTPGLGRPDGTDRTFALEVTWPSGERATAQRVKASQFIVVREGRGVTRAEPIIFARAAQTPTPAPQCR